MTEQLTPDIYRLKVPFADIYTTVLAVTTPGGTVLFDTASNAGDVDGHIGPALEKLGLSPDYVFISHDHGDHSGGLNRVMERWPGAVVLTRNRKLSALWGSRAVQPEDNFLEVLRPVFIPGHTLDAMGLLDRRSGTLLSGDCLQAYGVYGRGPWGSAVRHVGDHLKAVAMLREMELQTIVTAHDYHPFQAIVEKPRIPEFLDTCVEALEELRDMALAHPELTDEELTALCNARGLPVIHSRVVEGIRAAMEQGQI